MGVLDICAEEGDTVATSRFLELDPIERELTIVNDKCSLSEYGSLLKELESIEFRCQGASNESGTSNVAEMSSFGFGDGLQW